MNKMLAMEANALKGQQAHSPGQSEATPQVVGTYKIKNYTESVMITDMCLRIEFSTGYYAFALTGRIGGD